MPTCRLQGAFNQRVGCLLLAIDLENGYQLDLARGPIPRSMNSCTEDGGSGQARLHIFARFF